MPTINELAHRIANMHAAMNARLDRLDSAEGLREFISDRIGDLIEEPVEPRGILSRIERHLARIENRIDDSDVAGGVVVRALLLATAKLTLAIQCARDDGNVIPGNVLAASAEATDLLAAIERAELSNDNRSPA